ncbi:hypothetical protein EPUS_03767 [Endocarpon pusillum Z07020]|uniref:Methyltransferase type 11 domain-containing protein n=1 Tax=Endocarpon pusillum (strain Z07020 / HMAS-L-300199) TaxID=1263415 RepID=U1HHV2_ENDPU|nr:uncharacterized protein EPUS_03767 [Endocarpon pusillum Z07020]ERF68449.1 hypothetical protein EPUS_03767 [Endocarpon pusillum Z07020]
MIALRPGLTSPATHLRPLSFLLRPVIALDKPPYGPLTKLPRPILIKSTATSTQHFSTSTLDAQDATSQSSVSPTEISHFSRLASSWWDPHAIDPTPSVLAVAKEHQRHDPALSPPKLNYLNTAIEDLSVPVSDDEKVDIITLFEVLEHIDRPATFLGSCIPHLKRGGWIIAPLIGVVPPGTHDWNKYINPDELEAWFEKRSRQAPREERWGSMIKQGVVYVPGLGWKMIPFSDGWGNYFFGVQRSVD